MAEALRHVTLTASGHKFSLLVPSLVPDAFTGIDQPLSAEHGRLILALVDTIAAWTPANVTARCQAQSQGFKVTGVLVGSSGFVRAQLCDLLVKHLHTHTQLALMDNVQVA